MQAADSCTRIYAQCLNTHTHTLIHEQYASAGIAHCLYDWRCEALSDSGKGFCALHVYNLSVEQLFIADFCLVLSYMCIPLEKVTLS